MVPLFSSAINVLRVNKMDWMQTFGITSLNVLIFIFIVLNIDKVKIIISLLLKPLNGLRKINRISEALRYEGMINEYCSKIAPDFFSKSLNIKFASLDSLINTSKNDEVGNTITVYISRKQSRIPMLIDAIQGYVSNNLYPNIADSIEKNFTTANHLYICSKLISEFRDSAMKIEYSDKVFTPQSTQDVREYLSGIDELDQRYFYFQVFLNAIKQVDELSIGTVFNRELSTESTQFFEFLLDIAKKERGEDVDLTFEGKHFKYSVILVAKDETLSVSGFDSYLDRIKRCFRIPVNRIFLASLGSRNVDNLRRIEYLVKRMRGVEIFSQDEYTFYDGLGGTWPIGVLILDRTTDEILHEYQDQHEAVLVILKENIPEIEKGIIHVDAIARISGYACKVLVSTPNPNLKLIASCIGIKQQRKQAISESLNNEWVEFIENSENPKELITKSMPVSPQHIREVRISSGNKKAQVFVEDEKVGIVIGEGGRNIKIAQKLTGWKLTIERSSQLENDT